MNPFHRLPNSGIARSLAPTRPLPRTVDIPPMAAAIPPRFPRSRGLRVSLVLSPLVMTVVLHAATTGTDASSSWSFPGGLDAEGLGSVLGPVVSALVGKFGGILQGLTAMALLRTIFKPVMAALESALADHPTQAARLNQFERSMAYRALAFVLDLATSIKLHLITPPPGSGGTRTDSNSHTA